MHETTHQDINNSLYLTDGRDGVGHYSGCEIKWRKSYLSYLLCLLLLFQIQVGEKVFWQYVLKHGVPKKNHKFVTWIPKPE